MLFRISAMFRKNPSADLRLTYPLVIEGGIILALLIMIAGAVLRAIHFLTERDLWLDEAMLALNIVGIINGIGGILGGVLGFQYEPYPGASLNIYTQVGLVTLIGVISKHGILIVEFANKLQEEGMNKRQAIEEASAIRLRPVLMTTAALVLAMIPLLIATGPGNGARYAMGLVVSTGMTIGTAFTLFIVPAIYLYLGRDLEQERAAQAAIA